MWTCTVELVTAGSFFSRAMRRIEVWIWSRFSPLPDRAHESLFRATGLWTRVLANDVYGFHAWQSECLRSLQIGLPGIWPRTPGAPAALLRTLAHIPRSWLACWAFPAWERFLWRRVLWPLFGLRLHRHGEHASPVCLHVLPAQQSQQQQQSGPQQIRADRYVRKSTGARLNCYVINGSKSQNMRNHARVPVFLNCFLW